ncbi:hypothetical protein SHKM778_18480 [Streptomyces sp. KM77-8]|uniref:Uncharacterized protein n=1 Tax=Streptomyces haneummycinicus TaxID=3074435 RepID=A0AAT9HDL2_9ACTN
MQQPGIEPGDRGLAGTGRAAEDEVVADPGRGQSRRDPLAGVGEQADQVGDLPLDRGEPHHGGELGHRVGRAVVRRSRVATADGRRLRVADVLRQ